MKFAVHVQAASHNITPTFRTSVLFTGHDIVLDAGLPADRHLPQQSAREQFYYFVRSVLAGQALNSIQLFWSENVRRRMQLQLEQLQ